MKKLIILFDDNEKIYVENNNLHVNLDYLKRLNDDKLKALINSIEGDIFIPYYDGYLDFVNKTPILGSKKIFIDYHKFGIKEYDFLLKIRKQLNINNVYIKLEYNNAPVQIDLAIETMKKIKSISKLIKKNKLSPMESIMYAYDMVKDNVYGGKEEKETSKPRDLAEVLKRDNMVCMGFTNYFNSILTYLNIPCTEYYVNDHVRSCVYVKDEKYNIDGVYYFDSTWDCKKYDGEINYLQRYVNFAKTYNHFIKEDDEMISFDYKFDKFYNNFTYYIEKKSNIKDYNDINNWLKLCYDGIFTDAQMKYDLCYQYLEKEEKFIKRLLKGCRSKSITYSFLRNKYNGKELNKIVKKLIEERKKIFEEKWNNEIPGETMLELLNNVRKVQVKSGKSYDLCALEATGIAITSGWKFNENNEEKSVYENPTNQYHLVANCCKKLDIPFKIPFKTIEEKLLNSIFGEPERDKSEEEYINNYKKTISIFNDLPLEISNVLLIFFNNSMKGKAGYACFENQKHVIEEIMKKYFNQEVNIEEEIEDDEDIFDDKYYDDDEYYEEDGYYDDDDFEDDIEETPKQKIKK